jgi:hypothetical protein
MITSLRWIVFAFLLFLTGCNSSEPVKDSQLALMKTTNPHPISISHKKHQDRVEDVKKDVSSLPELYDVAVVKGDKDTLVVYKVKHLHRFRMKAIEKNINKMLEERHPKENFTVSSDYKVFLEAIRLKEYMQTPGFSKQKAEKRLQEIVKMTEDMK